MDLREGHPRIRHEYTNGGEASLDKETKTGMGEAVQE